ncbi:MULTISPECIES: hypothetical protein [unclassified Variovorax]|uniref:UGSC family (seleno)protein n=1 Tax=unclassified Variovorax TaxID=663243 RepID=UPI00076D5B51|nr:MULTISPECIES: hypothetical protein [unclassified Variovorax]KWT92074.1 hypothetical protein APY03_2988 [Variovorax sp. WDL1]PNG47023.1 hypothetical protein CHC06_07370 [Variovorax sp. B2]PNG48326.1 hypothetical protein CHC07_07498 [Variovorax sp. B4]VTV14877.1 hypothetical protein WDL1CHR_05344 [Variovorax sp. WDL1]
MTPVGNEGYFEAYWPRGARQAPPKVLAPRLPGLAGRRIAFLWDYLFRGDEIFDVVERQLNHRFQGMRFVGWREIGNIHGDDERRIVAALPGRLKALGVDAVVTAVAA